MGTESFFENREYPDVVRALGAHERLLYLYSQRHPRHFCIAAEIAGYLDLARLQLALQQLQVRHPPLSVCIQDLKDGPSFAADRRPIPVRLKEGGPSVRWQDLVEEELRTAFPTSSGPLVRLTLLPDTQDSEHCVLILTFHHALGDALSATAVLNDLVQLLNGRHLAALPQRPPIETLFADTRRDGTTNNNAPGAAIPSAQLLREISKKSLWRDFAIDKPGVDAQKFSSKETGRILTACRVHSATVQGALCAAVSIILARVKRTDSLTVVSPVNVRQQVDVGRSDIGLFLAIAPVAVHVPAGAGFWALARQFNEDLAIARSNDGIVAWLGRLEQIITPTADSDSACGLIGALAYDAVVSNLGVIATDWDPADTVRLTAIWGPCVLSRLKGECVIGAATLDGKLHLTHSGTEDDHGFIERVCSVLLAACEAPAVAAIQV